jgi:hypothetical protein
MPLFNDAVAAAEVITESNYVEGRRISIYAPTWGAYGHSAGQKMCPPTMEHSGSLPSSQDPVAGMYLEPVQYILHWMSKLPKWSFHFGLWQRFCMHFSAHLCVLHVLPISFLIWPPWYYLVKSTDYWAHYVLYFSIILLVLNILVLSIGILFWPYSDGPNLNPHRTYKITILYGESSSL